MAHPNGYQGYPQYPDYQNTPQQQRQYVNPQVVIHNPQPYYLRPNQYQQYQSHAAPQPQYGQPQYTDYNQNNYLQNGHFAPQQQTPYVQHQPHYPTPPTHLVPSDTITVMPSQSVPEPEPEIQRPPSPDYELVLMSLADEYLNEAHRKSSRLVADQMDDIESYDKLVVTALGCMDAVLRKWRLQPLLEAKLRLKYARVLFEETENDYEAETVLTKGIDLAKENRLWDLQYSMQVLLARLQHRLNPKAALKAVDSMIEDVEAYQHFQWIYIFRFLRISLTTSLTSNAEFQASIQSLQKVQSIAQRNGDQVVLVVSAIVEAMMHIQGNSSESLDLTQRALATARQMQLNAQLRAIPQIQIMIQLIDLCSSLQDSNFGQIESKLKVMQEMMDSVVDDPTWSSDGSFLIPISKKSSAGLTPLSDDIVHERNSVQYFSLSWLMKSDVYCIGYLLSAACMAYKNAMGHKAENFVNEGLKVIRKSLRSPETTSESLSMAKQRSGSRQVLECHFLLHRCFLQCGASDWDAARSSLDDVRKIQANLSLPIDLGCQLKYLEGAIHQATGDPDKALTIYEDPDLALPSTTTGATTSFKSSSSRTQIDIALLALMNKILILRSPTHPLHHTLSTHIDALNTHTLSTSTKSLLASHNLLLSTSTSLSQLQLKAYLQKSLNLANEIKNHQITAMTLALMSWKLFRGVVGEQAEKGAMATHATAKKAGSGLWQSVGAGMVADVLERGGRDKALVGKWNKEAEEGWKGLPEKVRMVTDGG